MFSFSPAPPTASQAQAVCIEEVRLSHAARPYDTLQISVEKKGLVGELEPDRGFIKESIQIRWERLCSQRVSRIVSQLLLSILGHLHSYVVS